VGSGSVGLDGRGARGGLDVMQLGLGDGPRVREARSGSRPGRPRPGGLAGRPEAGAAGGLESGVLGARRDWAGRRRGQAGSPDDTAAWSCRQVVVLWSGGGCGAERRSDVGAAGSRRRDRGPGPLPGEDTADEGVGLNRVDRCGQRPQGRFWLGWAGDRDVTVLAHRFAWALLPLLNWGPGVWVALAGRARLGVLLPSTSMAVATPSGAALPLPRTRRRWRRPDALLAA
jgi:hypothetical protein